MQFFISPKINFIFFLLFSKSENSDLLISLLTALLQPAIPISKVKILNPKDLTILKIYKKTILAVEVYLGPDLRASIDLKFDDSSPSEFCTAWYYQ